MSGLHRCAPQLLFLLLLMWLLACAAPVQYLKLVLGPVLLTSFFPEGMEPRPIPQVIPAQVPEVPEVGEPYSITEEASSQSAASPKLLKPWFMYGVHEKRPAAPRSIKSSMAKKRSALWQLPLATVEPSPVQQIGPTQPPKSSRNPEGTVSPPDLGVAIKPAASHPSSGADAKALQQNIAPKQPDVTLSHPGSDQAQPSAGSETTGRHFDVGLSIKSEPTVETGHPIALQQTTAPPEHSEMTLPLSGPVEPGQPAWSQITDQFEDEEFVRTLQPMSFATDPPGPEQSAIKNICELCSCSEETLSCTGLSPEQKLHQVPVPEPDVYNSSFTILILSDNNLRELHKDSFEGLLFLKYLDLSNNNIKFIEENIFETLPFLEYINLDGNSIVKLSSGMFRAWHGMQFFHTLILHQNPLTTIEDPYFFKLPALEYLDMGKTQVSLKIVEGIVAMSSKLEKLILPHHLGCCLCQFKTTIETVSRTVRLHCDTQCLKNTQCDEEVYFKGVEDSFVKILHDRKEDSAVLTIQPEPAPSSEKGNNLSDLLDLMMKLLSDREAAKSSRARSDISQLGQEQTEAQAGEEEPETPELINEVPEYGYKNKLLVAVPVIVVAVVYIIIFCLILICSRVASKEDARKPKGGGLWSWLMGTGPRSSEAQSLHERESTENDELLYNMEEEASSSPARTATAESAGEESEA